MSQPIKNRTLPNWPQALAVGILLSACGGGASPPSNAITTSGFAVDGYLSGATLLCDSNGNGSADSGEMTVMTDSGGGFTFVGGCNAGMVLTGGTSIDTNLPFSGQLKAPAGAKVVTPLTTLMSEGVTLAQLNAALGLPADTDILNTDPAYAPGGTLVNDVLMKVTAAVQVSAQKSTELLVALSGSTTAADQQAIYNEVIAAAADLLKAGNITLVTGSGNTAALDQAVVVSMVKAAADRVGQSASVSAVVKSAVNAVNSDSLALVAAGGIKAQAEAILQSGTALTAVTLAQQNDTQIATFISTNKAALSAEPTDNTVTGLATTLTNQISGGGGGGSSFAGIDFSAADIRFNAFEGLVSAAIENDPVAGASNKVAKFVKGPGGQPWAGATVYDKGTLIAGSPNANVYVDAFDLSSSKIVTLKSYTSAPIGTIITLKLENALDAGVNIAAQALTTQQNAWETLSFNFASLTTGVYSASATYNTASIFPAFSIQTGAGPALTVDTTFYFDDLAYTKVGSGGGTGATAPTNAPTTTIPAGALTVFSETTQAASFNPWPNWGQATTYSEATIASNKSLKYEGLNYEGITFDKINAAANSKLHIDFWSPALTSVEVHLITSAAITGAGAKDSSHTVTLTSGAWNSVDIDLSNFGVTDLTQIDQMMLVSGVSGTIYVDNIYFWGTAGGGGAVTPLVYASNYSDTPTPWKSVEGGDAGRYIDTGVVTQDWWSGLAAGDATPSYYFGYGTNSSAKPWGFGAFVKAPGNGTTASLASYSNVSIAVWGNDQLVNTNPHFTVILKGPSVNACTAELKGDIAVTAAGVQTYTLPLSGFTLQTPCAYSTVAQVLAGGVAEIHIQVLGANVQYVSGGDASGNFPNGLNVGPISFN